MKIFNYLEFINEENSEIVLPLQMSSDFLDRLNKIDSKISTKLISLSGRGSKPNSKYTLVSIGDDNDSISYSDSKKVSDYFISVGNNEPSSYLNRIEFLDSTNDIWMKNRVQIKIGRFIRKLFSQKSINITLTDAEVEDFVNQWKSISDSDDFGILTGWDISNGYITKNYSSNTGTLGNSCMNDETYLVRFYAYCPTAKLLVLLDDNKKILARALLWTDHEGRNIMDRIYYSYDKDYFKFIRWANENDYYYKKSNSNHFHSPFIKRGVISYLQSKVRIPNCFEFADDGFPYFDTFLYATGDWAQNYKPDASTERYFVLSETDGGYYDHILEKDIYGNIIDNSDHYFWSDTQGGYIHMDNAFKVEYYDRDYPKLSFDDWIELSYLEDPKNGFIKIGNLFYKKSHCKFSEKENKWYWIPEFENDN
jgi:hypothetical protein